ncbi:MAG: AraC family transcriptional regulator [Clostridia bacterium]|nr:AraC family transcriptional regulator [Clostridia bacterium]MBQ9964177.1 AraC family transcriptional regulator [Clostridia bacterium]
MERTLKTKEPNLFHYNRALSVTMSNMHYHDSYEIYYLLSGKRRYFINHKIFDLIPGDIILIPKNVIHNVLNSPGTEEGEYHERYLVTPHEEQIPENLRHCFQQNFYRLPPSISAHIKEEIQEMEKNFALNDEYTLQAYNAHLVNMLILLSRFGNSTASHEPELSHMSYIMQEAASYIDRNFHRNLTLSELAEKYSYSKEYFSGEFKKSTGRGFAEYLNHVRIVHALELLGDKSLHISDISAKCGFNDSNYFSSVFKKALGISPLQYRQKQY